MLLFVLLGAETEKWDEREVQWRILEKEERILGNDSRLLRYIRDYVLIPPLPRKVPYRLSSPKKHHFSQIGDQVTFLKTYFGNTSGGFFIEAGAYEGEALSNTLWLERERNWTGLLIEPDSTNFACLKQKRRKSWLAHSCLSPLPYAQKMSLEGGGSGGRMTPSRQEKNRQMHNIICFPLESFLWAIGQSKVDFFSLDIEGLDYKVLSSIPWDILDIRVLLVETYHVERNDVLRFMAEKKYRHVQNISADDVFEKLRN
ncbi:unnamed protein product [Darwinula stevensoni]|uniref:Methyltransferase FkbM domain-containing protein n=1 Tax=Darwinula stevensoni TaxID=69355 RepID=A0A7R9A7Y3_9CRUS|nr:unnamed protein product [Darwinula stevensoni]CAG0894034.1 unnamed protein product [Darwinula stevensoni]